MRRLSPLTAGVAAALLLTACGTTVYPNVPLAKDGMNSDPRRVQPTLSGTRPVILMAFSGGGSRAAGLSLAVIEELKNYSYTIGGTTRRLVDDVDVVSSVSGGSVTAAYFGFYGPDDTKRLKDFLARDNMAALELTGANPVTWARLAFGGYTRVDALRDLLDRELFDGKTFKEMAARGHPIVVLNATDMALGEVFSFTASRFNDICSDLSPLRISVGVAASAAFPVLLSPVDLKDYAGDGCVGAVPTPGWITADLQQHPNARYLNLEEFKRARYANALRRGPGAFRDVQYVHLLDGGLVDNLGAHSLDDVISSPHYSVQLLNSIATGEVSKLVVITVNARSDPPNAVSTEASTPGVVSMVNSVISDPIDAATAGAEAGLSALLDEIKTAAYGASKEASFKGMQVYNIQIDFDQFRQGQEQLQSIVKDTPTLWSIKPEQLAAIDQAGTLLLEQDPCFQKLLLDLSIHAPFIDASFATQVCPQPPGLKPPTPTARSRR